MNGKYVYSIVVVVILTMLLAISASANSELSTSELSDLTHSNVNARFIEWMNASRNAAVQPDLYDKSANPNIPDVRLWSVEGLALFAEEWAPHVVLAYTKKEDIYKIALMLCGIPYALPAENAIPQDEALNISQDALRTQLGWSDDLVSIYTPSVSYREYDQVTPVWRIGYRILRIDEDEQVEMIGKAYAGEMPLGAVVYINAWTGNIVSVTPQYELFVAQPFGEFDDGEKHIES